MGISIKNFEFMTQCFQKLSPEGIKGKLMLELGNQRIRNNVQKKYEINWETGKQYFESIGVKHYSIDKNGRDGAVPIDLSRPIIDDFWINKFDIGTDFGTLEHITNKNFGQYEAWKNFHNALKMGGFFVHSLPHPNGWPTHCNVKYDNEFIEKLSILNHYKIIYNDLANKGEKKALLQTCLIKKSDNVFMEDKELFTSWLHITKRQK